MIYFFKEQLKIYDKKNVFAAHVIVLMNDCLFDLWPNNFLKTYFKRWHPPNDIRGTLLNTFMVEVVH